ncbi:MAG: NAD(P)/FAD-dependent oxidoreductase [Frankiales bacterium]|nr:NAD(P)/FAD-dependent oxidoreductase [Frankiales bacterium]
MRTVVIAGAGLAGYRAAVALRRHGFDGKVVVVGDEPHEPYDRPPLSKQLLAGLPDTDHPPYPTEGLDLTWRLGRAAVGLDLAARRVALSDGTDEPFDALVVATGRRARPWPGLRQLAGVHVLRTVDDARALSRAAHPGARVVIVGAGFIGCEVAATLRGRGVVDVTLVDVAALPLRPLGQQVGSLLAAVHEAHGLRLRLGASVESFEGDQSVEAVRLADGERLPADIVLLALGSLPNTGWLAGSGVTLHRGSVRCDEHCFAVGTEDVVTAGDVAAFPYPGADDLVSVEHWSNAREMADHAVENLLAVPGDRSPYRPVPTFWSNQYDVQLKAVGLLSLADRFVTVEEETRRPALVVEARAGDKVVGAVLVNRNRAFVDYQRRLSETLAAPALRAAG